MGAPSGTRFLATRPPWLCSCCHVTCTSAETLAGHAAGKKHRSKARAADAAEAPPVGKRPREETPADAAETPAEAAPATVRVIKWRRIAGEVLGASPGGVLSQEALQTAVLAAVRAQYGAAAGDAVALAAGYSAEVAGSKRFRADSDGRVALKVKPR
jgi:hypothetical protein